MDHVTTARTGLTALFIGAIAIASCQEPREPAGITGPSGPAPPAPVYSLVPSPPVVQIEDSAMTSSDDNLDSLVYVNPSEANFMVVFVSGHDQDSAAVITATYGDIPLTKIKQAQLNDADVRSAMFVMADPPTCSCTLKGIFTGSSSVFSRAIAVYSLSGVKGVRAWSDTTAVFSDKTLQLTVDSEQGDLVLDHIRWRQAPPDVVASPPGGIQTLQMTDSLRQVSTSAGGLSGSTTVSQTTDSVHGGNRATYFALSLEPGLDGIWATPADLKQQPMSGDDWDAILANRDNFDLNVEVADLANPDSHHDQYTLAKALVCVRTHAGCPQAAAGVVAAIGTEDDANWLEVSRNLGAYIIAADLMDLRANGLPGSNRTKVQEWLEEWPTKLLKDNLDSTETRGIEAFGSGSNASAQEGFIYAAWPPTWRTRPCSTTHGRDSGRTHVTRASKIPPRSILGRA
jgi:hypothetical protein